MDSQMIGRRGEKRFDLMCSDAGVTCNRSIEDDYGWDKLIEFPARLVPFASIDMQPGHVVAAVQVKTTTGSSRTVSISLSNALRYAKSDIPQFVVLVTLDGAEPRYFARHVWSVLIADWLKAARQADANGVTATHQSSVSLGFSLQDERGPGLLDWIRAEVEAVPAPYATAKRRFVDTVGFEHGFGTAHMTLTLRNVDEMIDIQLGLRPHVDAKRFTYTSERFGIRARRPEIDESDVQVHLTPEGRRCTLRLEFHNGEGLTVPARLYSARRWLLRGPSRVPPARGDRGAEGPDPRPRIVPTRRHGEAGGDLRLRDPDGEQARRGRLDPRERGRAGPRPRFDHDEAGRPERGVGVAGARHKRD
ncbi:hypothetical protein ASE67_02145 [Sphingomonas sp. Leaf23]|uniref:hypothetical protein n=1 Tax=Sphingomonas sp. Leaf23 TaxID=1735689 RepID=UPI0006FD6744|nr:hypothetical protein [Sphingomonas sp. Leaf23]KQM88568.1 hypothetical protein ASE67_02145 [Sphingomonas sp. Leaf23]